MIWKLIKTLRLEVIIAFVIIWNVLMGVGIAMNGGVGKIRTTPGAIAMALTCGALAVFCFGTVLIAAWQRIMLRPTADPAQAKPGLLFIGLVSSFLSAGGVVTAIGIFGNHT
jgi:hypothetical protein